MTSVRARIGQLRAQTVSLGFAAGWAVVKALPVQVAARGFEWGADLAVRRDGPGAGQLRRNLRRVIGASATEVELEALLKQAMRSYARYWLETFRLPKMDKDSVRANLEANTIGGNYVDDAVAAGRGYVLALPHIGNWDVSGLWLVGRTGAGFTTVAERLKPESLFDRFVAYRESLGMEVLALTGDEQPPTSLLIGRLKAGGGVCLVADRDLSQRGIEVDFFGEPARMPAGPAMLAALTGADLLPVVMWFTEDGWAQRICAPIDVGAGTLRARVERGTQALAAQFAELIAVHPQDWHMLQPFWIADQPAAQTAER